MWMMSLVAALAAPSLSVGQGHSCAVLDAEVWCWGGATVEQLRGEGSPRKVAQRQGGLPPILEVAVGGRGQTCAAAVDGSLWCWGLGEVPVRKEGYDGVVAVAVGGSHGCAVSGDSSVRCWGRDGHGALGDTVVPGVSEVRQIRAGEGHTCALQATGAVQCWGPTIWGSWAAGVSRPTRGPARWPSSATP